MKIIHLSTSISGGAGVVAARLAQIAARDGHSVRVITLSPEKSPIVVSVKRNLFRKTLAKLSTLVSLLGTNSRWRQLTSYSLSAKVLKMISEFEPDIVHIHNWFNILNVDEIEDLLNQYPCVFHIHDARLMTGGCHFTLDCLNYLNGCANCSATKIKRQHVRSSFLNLESKFKINKIYGLVFLSDWLQEKFKYSSISMNSSINCKILNPINLNGVNSTTQKSENRICCVISELGVSVKGFDLFLDAIELLRIKGMNFEVQVVGGGPTSDQLTRSRLLDIQLLGRLSNNETLDVISSSSLIVVPSFSENSPTVVLEAQALGTCVLATDIPGNRELVCDGVTGFISDLTGVALADGVVRALSSDAFEQVISNAQENLQKTFDESVLRLYDVYSQVNLLHRSRNQT